MFLFPFSNCKNAPKSHFLLPFSKPIANFFFLLVMIYNCMYIIVYKVKTE